MLELRVDWKFKDIQENIRALKSQYDRDLMPFLCIELKKKQEFTHEIKERIFNYENIQYWQRERLWETLNGDMDIEEFINLGG